MQGSAYGRVLDDFQHTMEGQDLSSVVTVLSMFMDRAVMGVGNTNPGFSRPAVARSAFVHWAFLAENVAGAWTLHLRKNEGLTDEATINLPAGAPGAFVKVDADWSSQVRFEAGDTYHVVADGPSKNLVLMRVIPRFQEL